MIFFTTGPPMPSLWRTGTRHQPSSQACPCPPIPSQFETSGLSSRVFLGRGQGYLVGSTDLVNQTFVRNIPGPPLRAPVRRTQWAPELVWPWLTFKNDLSMWKGRGLWCVVVQWENPWLSFSIIKIILKNNVFIMCSGRTRCAMKPLLQLALPLCQDFQDVLRL